jgi:mannose-6-phosphate isomerase
MGGHELNKWHFAETPYKFTDLKAAIRKKFTRRGGQSAVESPLTFQPLFKERIWGGRRLETELGKNLPPQKRIGESWEIVDRPEAQSVVVNGPLRGKTLHELWTQHRGEIFGGVPGASRFPLLVKLLDAHEKLSLQVHPPEKVASKLRGEPKSEFWYVAAADPGAQLYLGFRDSITRDEFEKALRDGTAADHVHQIDVKPGDAVFLPAGRFHAVGAGNLLIEIQQNSDTTYRVFDWNRLDPTTGQPRALHVEHALQCIDFNDARPKMAEPLGELLAKNELFEIQKWHLNSPREIALSGQFAIACCLSGSLRCAQVTLGPGEFFLIPAQVRSRQMHPLSTHTSLLRITVPLR